VVEGGGLENRRRSRARGFESLPLRQIILALWCLASWSAKADPPRHAWIEPALERQLSDPLVEHRELRVMLDPLGGKSAGLSLDALQALGARIDARSRSFVRISAPPAVLRQVSELGGIRALRFPFRPIPMLGLGTVLSEAVSLTGAAALQTSGLTGAGVKVAIIDAGFTHYTDAQAFGDLPASLIPVDFTGTGMDGDTAHGTSVSEEVADMAPGAQLYLLNFSDELELENAVDYVRDNGIRIVNFSINFFGTSYYDDTGPINDIVNHSHDVDGVFWAVAQGNWAFRHWHGPWVDTDADRFEEFAPGVERLGVVPELTNVCWTMNWNQYPDHYTGTLTDLDLFVYSSTGAVVASSQVRQTAGMFPVEQACYTRNPAQEPYQLGVKRFSGPTPDGLDLTIVGSGAAVDPTQAVPAGSVLDPSVAHGALSVGAIDQAQWTQAPPGPNIENFSSWGPTRDGRVKPDIVAPDRTQTLYYGAAIGTSFASPVVAGAAALLMQQVPSISANQLRAALIARAHDVGTPGLDTVFGWGELVVTPLVVPLDSDGDSVADGLDPCPFAPGTALCHCGDVDASGTVTPSDELGVRQHLADPSGSVALFAHPELCNVIGAANPLGGDCRIDDWAVLRRARDGKLPGIQQVCAPALPP
jgi:subtilisin family serine protease